MKSLKYILAILIALQAIYLPAQDKVTTEKPFIVHDKSNKISRVDIRKDVKGAVNVIQINASNASGGVGLAARGTLAAAEITDINIINGSYNQTREIAKTSRGMSTELLNVVFPCRIRLTISDQILDVEIKEAGFWKVTVAMIN